MESESLLLLRKFVHAIRNPLSSIIGTVDMFNEGMMGELTPPQTRAIDRLDRNSQRILALLDEFIIYSKASAGEYPIHTHPFSPASLLQKTIQPPLAEKNLPLTLSIPADFPAQLMGDADLLEKMIAALLWNAVEATEHGPINLLNSWDNGWQLDMIDTGCGIPSENQADIFEPFWQGESKSQLSPSSHFGLGLPMARALAQLMGGSLTLEKSTTEGSHFRLFLPLKQADSE